VTVFTGDLVDLSRAISHALRHDPGAYGVHLDGEGWVDVDELLAAIGRRKKSLAGATEQQLRDILATSEKTRFEIRDGRVRARYGHSIAEKIEHAPIDDPPPLLFHGTARRNEASILEKGLLPSGRQYVHLSGDRALAEKVGRRHGDPSSSSSTPPSRARMASGSSSSTMTCIWPTRFRPAP